MVDLDLSTGNGTWAFNEEEYLDFNFHSSIWKGFPIYSLPRNHSSFLRQPLLFLLAHLCTNDKTAIVFD